MSEAYWTPLSPPVWAELPRLFEDNAHATVLNRETVGADAFARSYDRIDRSGLLSIIDDRTGRNLSPNTMDSLRPGMNIPRDSMIQGANDHMIAMYNSTGKVLNFSA